MNILDLVCAEEDTNQDQEQEELVVICYFVGTHTRLKGVTRYVVINQKLNLLFNILIRFVYLIMLI